MHFGCGQLEFEHTVLRGWTPPLLGEQPLHCLADFRGFAETADGVTLLQFLEKAVSGGGVCAVRVG